MYMATGTVIISEKKLSAMERINFEWTSTSGGSAGDTTVNSYDGLVYRVIISPGTSDSTPDADYAVAINDSDEHDILNGLGGDCSTGSADQYGVLSTGGVQRSPITAVSSKLTLAVTGAGSSNSGEVIVYIR